MSSSADTGEYGRCVAVYGLHPIGPSAYHRHLCFVNAYDTFEVLDQIQSMLKKEGTRQLTNALER